jgi:hypothetical protein
MTLVHRQPVRRRSKSAMHIVIIIIRSYSPETCMPGFTVLSAVGSYRRMMGIRANQPSNVELAVCKQPQPIHSEWSRPRPGRDVSMHPKNEREAVMVRA